MTAQWVLRHGLVHVLGVQGKTQVRQRRATKAEKRQQRFEAEEYARPEREEIFEIPLQGMSLQELADRLATGQGEIIASLFRRGIMVQVSLPAPLSSGLEQSEPLFIMIWTK